jgi:hypothetical protein
MNNTTECHIRIPTTLAKYQIHKHAQLTQKGGWFKPVMVNSKADWSHKNPQCNIHLVVVYLWHRYVLSIYGLPSWLSAAKFAAPVEYHPATSRLHKSFMSHIDWRNHHTVSRSRWSQQVAYILAAITNYKLLFFGTCIFKVSNASRKRT